MTIREFGSTIRNRVKDGLKGEIKNVSYSVSQLISESFLLRSRLILEESRKAKIDLTSFYQTFDSLPIKEIDIQVNSDIKSGICTSYVEFPALASTFMGIQLEYIGFNTRDVNSKSFMFYFDDRFKTHQNTLRMSKKIYTYVDVDRGSTGLVKAFLYNIGPFKDKKYLSVRGIFDDPTVFMSSGCCDEIWDQEFPAPGWMQDIIIERLSMSYVEQYRKMNIPEFSNKQVDIKG
jgi:hypothetical protein